MNVNIDYNESITSIDEMLGNLPKEFQKNEQAVLRKTGSIIKQNVMKQLHDSNIEAKSKLIPPSNYDKSRPYVHLKDDVKAVVKKDKMGNSYVSVRGGKYTGYKWGPLSDGHIARDGTTFVEGTNFIGRSIQTSEGEIENLINDMLKKAVE